MRDIINRNDKGQLHGYHEVYLGDGDIWFKCFFNNGIQVDYEEWYYYGGGNLKFKSFYI